ncbi:unnamed protein product [Parnassius mnemosyne]|uniref:HAT C-terminal dimerisation domain-containing protein n=1 Tax=Parnassius mnemosyne TaxID=213953 RepID=A0AAV1L0F7_9NEOP
MQKRLCLPILKLKQDVATRWNSTYDMLHRFSSTKDAIIATIALIKPDLALTDYEWMIIQSVHPVLKMFYDVTVEVSGDKNISLAKVIPLCRIMLGHIRSRLQVQNTDANQHIPEIKNVIEHLHKELNHRFGHIESNILNAESTILDPRFKNKGFQDSRLYGRALQDLKLKIGRSSSRTTIMPAVEAVQPESCPNHSIWFEFDQEVVRQTPDNPTAAGIVELDKYLQEPLLKRTEDPLKWWHARRNIYPLLFHYVLKRHNLVATSVPCERIFSKAGYTLNERRRRLTTKKVSQLLFISCNSDI